MHGKRYKIGCVIPRATKPAGSVSRTIVAGHYVLLAADVLPVSRPDPDVSDHREQPRDAGTVSTALHEVFEGSVIDKAYDWGSLFNSAMPRTGTLQPTGI